MTGVWRARVGADLAMDGVEIYLRRRLDDQRVEVVAPVMLGFETIVVEPGTQTQARPMLRLPDEHALALLDALSSPNPAPPAAPAATRSARKASAAASLLTTPATTPSWPASNESSASDTPNARPRSKAAGGDRRPASPPQVGQPIQQETSRREH